MSHHLGFWEWLMLFCFMGLAFGSLYVGMRDFGARRKRLLKIAMFSSMSVAVFQFVYEGAKYFGLTWLWFSNPWLFSVLLGLVCGSVYVGIRRLMMVWR